MTKYLLKYYLLIVFTTLSFSLSAQQYTEYDLKAAYVFNFSKFVSWPTNAFENDDSDFNIVVFGDSPITKVLFKAFKGRKIQNRDISIKVIYRIEDLPNTHILFVSKEMQVEVANLIEHINDKPILVVGDVVESFCQLGGTINLTSRSSKYQFEINNNAAIKSHLKISSKLLALSKIITSDEIKF